MKFIIIDKYKLTTDYTCIEYDCNHTIENQVNSYACIYICKLDSIENDQFDYDCCLNKLCTHNITKQFHHSWPYNWLLTGL